MSVGKISNVIVKGIACSVPKRKATISDLASAFGTNEAERLVDSTGVNERRSDSSLCTSDLCAEAAEKLMSEMGWERDSVNHLIFVSQTADYLMPTTACVLQDRLGLSTSCAAFDVNLGCSGYTYGLSIIGNMLKSGERGLLLVGDTTTRALAPDNRACIPIFGDAGSATALEYSEENTGDEIRYSMGTDGSGFENIMIEAGGYRLPYNQVNVDESIDLKDTDKDPRFMHMDGAEVMSFVIQSIPKLIEDTLEYAGLRMVDCDDFIFHQANGFILKYLAKKMEIPIEKVPIGLKSYGNTSSASIPLTLVTERREELRNDTRRYLLAGFGVGWSWAAASIQMGGLCIPELLEVDSL